MLSLSSTLKYLRDAVGVPTLCKAFSSLATCTDPSLPLECSNVLWKDHDFDLCRKEFSGIDSEQNHPIYNGMIPTGSRATRYLRGWQNTSLRTNGSKGKVLLHPRSCAASCCHKILDRSFGPCASCFSCPKWRRHTFHTPGMQPLDTPGYATAPM